MYEYCTTDFRMKKKLGQSHMIKNNHNLIIFITFSYNARVFLDLQSVSIGLLQYISTFDSIATNSGSYTIFHHRNTVCMYVRHFQKVLLRKYTWRPIFKFSSHISYVHVHTPPRKLALLRVCQLFVSLEKLTYSQTLSWTIMVQSTGTVSIYIIMTTSLTDSGERTVFQIVSNLSC